jgi:hypothetical protein
MSRVENALSPAPLGLVITPTVMSMVSFPQWPPHPCDDCRILLFSGIAQDIHFSTGSTTNTKNMNQDFVLS